MLTYPTTDRSSDQLLLTMTLALDAPEPYDNFPPPFANKVMTVDISSLMSTLDRLGALSLLWAGPSNRILEDKLLIMLTEQDDEFAAQERLSRLMYSGSNLLTIQQLTYRNPVDISVVVPAVVGGATMSVGALLYFARRIFSIDLDIRLDRAAKRQALSNYPSEKEVAEESARIQALVETPENEALVRLGEPPRHEPHDETRIAVSREAVEKSRWRAERGYVVWVGDDEADGDGTSTALV